MKNPVAVGFIGPKGQCKVVCRTIAMCDGYRGAVRVEPEHGPGYPLKIEAGITALSREDALLNAKREAEDLAKSNCWPIRWQNSF